MKTSEVSALVGRGGEIPDPNRSIGELRSILENLGPSSVVGTNEAFVVSKCIKFSTGNPELLIEYAEDQFATAVTAEREFLLPYLRIGKDESTIHPDIIENPSYDYRLSLGASPWDTDSWGVTLQESGSQRPSDYADALVELVETEFDPEAYNSIVKSTSNQRCLNESIRKSVSDVARILGHRIADFSTNPNTVKRFIDSPLFRTLDDLELNLKLKVKVADLEGLYTAEGGINPSFQEVIDIVKSRVTDRRSAIGVVYGLNQIVEHAPQLVTELANQGEHVNLRVLGYAAEKLYAKKPDEQTEAEQKLLADIEAVASRDFCEFYSIMSEKATATGKISPQDAAKLLELSIQVENDGYHTYYDANRYRFGWLYFEDFEKVVNGVNSLIGAYISDDAMRDALEQHPWLTLKNDTKSIVIRRLSRLGDTDKALQLVDAQSSTTDSGAKLVEPIMNILAIYDETGDDRILAIADERIEQERKCKRFGWDEIYTEHGIAMQKYLAALRHGNEQLAQDSLQAVMACAREGEPWEKDRTLRDTYEMFVSIGDLDAARDVAEVFETADALNRDNLFRHDMDLNLIKAFVDSGHVAEATNHALSKLARQAPYTYELLSAIEYILSDETERPRVFIPPLYGRTIRPTSLAA